MLHHSETLLRKAIRAFPQSINQPNNIGQTPLHLSLDWPCGIDILLEAGADVDRVDSDGLPPIVYACQRSLIEAVWRLGNVECALYPPDMPWFFQWHSVLQSAMREEVTFYPQYLNITVEARQNVVDCVIELVADRRKRLQARATAFLSSEATDRLNISKHRVLDEYAASTMSALRDHNIFIPHALLPGSRRTTVYHIPCLTIRTARRLWKAGFRDVDGFDHRGRTPLMIRRFFNQINLSTELELIAWFQSKGADLHRAQRHNIRGIGFKPKKNDVCTLGSKSSVTAVYWIAKNIGQTIKDFLWENINHRLSYVGPSWTLSHLAEERQHQLWQSFSQLMNISDVAKQVLVQILTDPIRDDCNCACSTEGCQLLITILKIFRQDTNCPVGRMMKMQISIVLADLIESSSSPSSPTFFSQLIRSLTFEELDLTHTCCTHFLDHILPPPNNPNSHEDDIHEIHDEERHLLHQLEELLLEFEMKKSELGGSTKGFLQGYWRVRMDEILSEKPARNCWDERELRRVGVYIV